MEDRLITIETKIAFLERNLSELDEVVRDLSTELTEYRKRLLQIESASKEDGDSSGTQSLGPGGSPF
ncbi:MAG: SlyX family protein [Planctomycetota bacterium]